MFQVKKLRGSVMAKITAWVLCIASVLGTIVLGICMVYGFFDNLYDRTREETLKDIYKRVNGFYSQQVFEERNNNNHAEIMRNHYFRYGIIQSNLASVDFYDRCSYVDTNMTDKELADIDPDQLYLYRMIDNGQDYEGMSMGYYGSYEDISALDAMSSDLIRQDSRWTYLYADRICYDVAKGIVYYRANEHYYPVQNVSLCYDNSEGRVIYNYDYDFDNQGYRLNYHGPDDGESWAGEYASEYTADGETAQAQTGRIEEILSGSGNGSMVNLAELNNTTFSNSNWGTILLDNIRSIDGDELTLIDSNDIADEFFVREDGYYLNEDYTLVVQENILSEVYWVVSIVPDFVPSDRMNNLYSQESWFVNFYYDIVDRNLPQGLGISIAVMVLSFGFLMYAAGHRKTVDGIVLTPLDRIPIEVASAIVFGMEFGFLFLLMVVIELTGISQSAYATMETCGLFGTIMIAVAVAYILSFCVRVKAGKWWRNSICYRIYSWIRDTVVSIFQHIGLIWKAVVIIGAISFVEFSILINFDLESIVVLWLIEKLILCAFLCILVIQVHELQEAGQCMADGDLAYKINTAKMFWECKRHGENLNKISEGMSKAVDERMKSERLKTELITNVSHDIKTPLTSLINYVDLLSKEELHNEKATEYLEVLDRQSAKLKKLIEDLMEASKASSGSLPVDSQQLEAGVFVTQTVGEFEEKLSLAGLELIVSKPEEPVYIMADGRHIWRVVDNLMNNICKYSQTGSRVYVNLEATEKSVSITFRNISKYPLNINSEELTERFVRGDKSRSTEGHGLGLSIAQSLMKLTGGRMNIIVDGDLFKVVLAFDRFIPDIQELDFEKEDIDSDSQDLV